MTNYRPCTFYCENMIQEILECLLVSGISVRASTCTLTTDKPTDFNHLTLFYFCNLHDFFFSHFSHSSLFYLGFQFFIQFGV